MNRTTASIAIFCAAAITVASCSSGTGRGSPFMDAESSPPARTAPANLPEASVMTAPAPPFSTPAAPRTTDAAPPAAPRTSAATPLETAEPVPPQGQDASPDTMYCPGGSHEGCHNKADMETYLKHMLALISPMFDEVYGASNRPANFFFIGTGETGEGNCVDPNGDPSYGDQDYYYCPTDQSIYTGQEQLWDYYYDIGDAAPAIAYAHEWGHHIQEIMGVDNNLPQNATDEHLRQHTIRSENQADCIAGVWLYYADTQGWLEYPDDIGDLEATLQEIASSEANPKRTHGTLKERTESLLHGYNQGLLGCNAFFPNTPIYQG